MKKEKSIKEWGSDIANSATSPHILSQINVQLAGYYAYKNGLYVVEKIKWAKWYGESKIDSEGKKNSDKYLDALYLMTEDGQALYLLKKEIRSYEKMMDAVKSAIFVANQEVKNTNI